MDAHFFVKGYLVAFGFRPPPGHMEIFLPALPISSDLSGFSHPFSFEKEVKLANTIF